MSARQAHAIMVGAAFAASCAPDSDPPWKGDEPGRYASKVCDVMESCGCFSRFASAEECRAILEERFSELLRRPVDLTPECFEAVLADAAIVSDCRPVDAWASPRECRVIRGHLLADESCDRKAQDLPLFTVSECAQGLSCHDGVCKAGTLHFREVGDDCTVGDPTSCGATDLYCRDDGVCEPQVGLSQTCDSPFACNQQESDAGAYCAGIRPDGTGSCAERAASGEACDPLDYNACRGPGATRGWCNPQNWQCEEGPGICVAVDFPAVWP